MNVLLQQQLLFIFQDWTNSKQIAQLVYTEFFTQVLKCEHMYCMFKKNYFKFRAKVMWICEYNYYNAAGPSLKKSLASLYGD